jgi:hypothetical protein
MDSEENDLKIDLKLLKTKLYLKHLKIDNFGQNSKLGLPNMCPANWILALKNDLFVVLRHIIKSKYKSFFQDFIFATLIFWV